MSADNRLTSIVSYPERGTGGNNRYRGNCSPKLIEDLIGFFKPAEICDYMCGSGTTQDAAHTMGIISHCYDLHSGFDLINCEIPERPEFVFGAQWHSQATLPCLTTIRLSILYTSFSKNLIRSVTTSESTPTCSGYSALSSIIISPFSNKAFAAACAAFHSLLYHVLLIKAKKN